ncbi:MAG: hypothetical protein AAF389_05590 [Gemmatimonadota bacterium]
MRGGMVGSDGEGIPGWRRAARAVHLGVARLLWIGVLLQFYSSWLMLAGRPHVHAVGGWLLIAGGVLAGGSAVAGYGLRAPRVGRACLLVLLLIAQPVIAFVLAARSPFLGAFHPLNGLLVFVLLTGLSRADRALGPLAPSRSPAL